MIQTHSYTRYPRRWQPVSILVAAESAYFIFILRAECIFVAWLVVFILMIVRAVSGGPASYQAFLEWSGSWPIVLLNVISLLFVVFHAFTFFIAAPQALVVHLGRRRVPGSAIVAGHYAALLAASLLVAWLLLGA